jgi:hypothetical protein
MAGRPALGKAWLAALSGWELELEQTQVAVRYLLPSRSRGVAQLQTLAGQQSIDVVGRDERGCQGRVGTGMQAGLASGSGGSWSQEDMQPVRVM